MEVERGRVLAVDKPAGPTSHDIVGAARRALGTRRIGHTGTLDPFATGLLLLCIGPATRLVEYLVGHAKAYRAVVRLGAATDTDDSTGTVVATSQAWRELDEQDVRAALDAGTGSVQQVPPAYSAKRVAGRRMHELARAGAAPTLPPQAVQIHELRLLDLALPELCLEVRCSAGTYVRAIGRDLGVALGCFAHLTSLRRERIARFDVRNAVPAHALGDASRLERASTTPLDAIAHLPRIGVEDAQAAAVASGRAIGRPAGAPRTGAVALHSAGELLAIAEIDGGQIRPRKVFRA